VLYREVASGTKQRPEWERLLEDARTARIHAVVVFSINRIGRRRIQIARDLATLARYGASIVSVCERFVDVDSSPDMAPTRDLLIQWWGWFAEREREEIVTRTRNALDVVKENIRKHGYHVSIKGRRIEHLGPPSYPKQWRQRAIAIHAEGETNYAAIVRRIKAEGGPPITRGIVRLWVLAHQATTPKDDAPHTTATTERRADA
jgi:DNA invertase Pin-like site-specific DNA recombinase